MQALVDHAGCWRWCTDSIELRLAWNISSPNFCGLQVGQQERNRLTANLYMGPNTENESSALLQRLSKEHWMCRNMGKLCLSFWVLNRFERNEAKLIMGTADHFIKITIRAPCWALILIHGLHKHGLKRCAGEHWGWYSPSFIIFVHGSRISGPT